MKTRCWNSPKPSRVTVVDEAVRKSMKEQEKGLLSLRQRRILSKLDMKKDSVLNQKLA